MMLERARRLSDAVDGAENRALIENRVPIDDERVTLAKASRQQ